MRLSCNLLMAATTLLASSEALTEFGHNQAAKITSNTVDSFEPAQHDGHTKRFWRSYSDEERAFAKPEVFANIKGFDRTKAEAKEWLTLWLNQGERVDSVAKKLGLSGLANEKALNSAALQKYRNMVHKRKGESLSGTATFSRIDGIARTKTQTKHLFRKWLQNEESVESVAKKLGVFGLKQEEAVKSLNWRALASYQKMFSKWKSTKVFATVDGAKMTESQTHKWLLEMLENKETTENVAKKLGVWGIKQEDIPNALNWPALVKYVRMEKGLDAM